jgi:hypothetical protein
MAKPTLFYGIMKTDFMRQSKGPYEILRVTSESDNQIGGVRDGDLGGVAFTKQNLAGRAKTLEEAKARIIKAEEVRKRHHIPIRDLENKISRMTKDMHREIGLVLTGEAK